MPTRLARWVCVLTALAAGSTFAADKPKEKKGKPANPLVGAAAGAIIGPATGNPKTGAVVGPINGGLIGSSVGTLPGDEADKPKNKKGKPATPTRIPESDLPPITLPAQTPRNADSTFAITKPVGTWVRDVNIGDAAGRFTLEVTDNRLVLKIDAVHEKQTVNGRVSVDYSINKESTLFGVIDSCEVKSSEKVEPEKLGQFAKFSGQPFAVRFRVEDDGLTFKDFKGLGVGFGDKAPEEISNLLIMMNGRYAKVDPSKPLPELKAKESSGSELRLDRVPLPTPHYLKHYPTYIAPDPAIPLQKERDEMLDPWGENTRFGLTAAAALGVPSGVCIPTTPTTSAYAGPISGAVPMPSRPDATVVQAKSEVSAAEPPRLIPQLREDDCPKCDPPTDAEVMQVFNARVLKDAGPGFEAAHDDIVIVKHLVSDKIDAPRVYPHVGLAQTHCCRWECGVYYGDPKQSSNPSPTYIRKPKVEVISIEMSSVRPVVPTGDTAIPQRMTEK